MIMSLKQRKIKFEPRVKLNHNIYTDYSDYTDTVNTLTTFTTVTTLTAQIFHVLGFTWNFTSGTGI